MNTFFFQFVTRDRCPLCREGEVVVRRVAALLRSPVISVQVEDDDDLLREFALRIPVVVGPGGQVLDEGNIEFRVLLRRALVARLRAFVTRRT